MIKSEFSAFILVIKWISNKVHKPDSFWTNLTIDIPVCMPVEENRVPYIPTRPSAWIKSSITIVEQ